MGMRQIFENFNYRQAIATKSSRCSKRIKGNSAVRQNCPDEPSEVSFFALEAGTVAELAIERLCLNGCIAMVRARRFPPIIRFVTGCVIAAVANASYRMH